MKTSLLKHLSQFCLATVLGFGATMAWALEDVPTQDIDGLRDLSSIKRFADAVLVWRDEVSYDEVAFPAGKVSYSGEKLLASKSVQRSGERNTLVYITPAGKSPVEVLRFYQNELKSAGFKSLFECVENTCGRADALTGGNNFNFANTLFKDAAYSTSRSEAHVCAAGYPITGFRYTLMENTKTSETLAVMTWRPVVKGFALPCPDEIEKHTSVMIFHVQGK